MLNRIRVKNFKSFKDLDYPCAKLNLLMGVNGAGKSSFVQLMLLMRRLAQQPLKAKITIPVGECSVSYEDLRYAYEGKEEEISFSIDFMARA